MLHCPAKRCGGYHEDDLARAGLGISNYAFLREGKEFLALSTDEQTQTIQEIAVDVSRKKAERAAKKSLENYPKPVPDPELIRRLEASEPPRPVPKFQVTNDPPTAELDLKELGCGGWGMVTVQEAIQHREQGFNYPLRLTLFLSFGIAIALVASSAVYGIVRAIGWVIGGFVT